MPQAFNEKAPLALTDTSLKRGVNESFSTVYAASRCMTKGIGFPNGIIRRSALDACHAVAFGRGGLGVGLRPRRVYPPAWMPYGQEAGSERRLLFSIPLFALFYLSALSAILVAP
jgi:hypothetical protein